MSKPGFIIFNDNAFYLIEDLSDTVITSVADNEVLAYDTSTSKWINQTLTETGAATIELDNLGTVAVNTSLISDTDSTDDLGSSAKYWKDGYIDNLVAPVTVGDGTNQTLFAADGLLTQEGTARVTVDMYITASGVKAPAANPAAFIIYGLCGAWEFEEKAGGSEENISGSLKLPSQMDKTVAPVFKVGWSAPGSSPGTCVWQLEYLYMSPNEDSANTTPDDTLTTIGTASATADGLAITAFAALATPSATDQAMFFKITRLNNDGDDNIGASIHLRGLLFTHTRDKLGTAT